MQTSFLQVKDNAKTLALANSLNNTTTPLTLTDIDTSSFPEVTVGYAVTIWDDATYPDPGDDPNMEKCLVTDAAIGSAGYLTITRGAPKSHTGAPRIALLALAQHIGDLETAVNALENTVHYEQPFISATTVTVTHNLHRRPAVTVIDSAGDECEGDISHTSNNQLTLTFTAPFSGVVLCN